MQRKQISSLREHLLSLTVFNSFEERNNKDETSIGVVNVSKTCIDFELNHSSKEQPGLTDNKSEDKIKSIEN